MKKLLIIAVLVAMVLGLMSVTGAAAEGPPSPPAPFETEDAVLVTVCEDLTLEYGDNIPFKAIDTKGYNKFKLYVYMIPVEETDFESINATYMRISLQECATPDPEKYAYLLRSPDPNVDWIKWNLIPGVRPGYYSMVIPVQEGIYSVLKVGGTYKKFPPSPPAPPGQPPVTVSVYLLMAK